MQIDTSGPSALPRVRSDERRTYLRGRSARVGELRGEELRGDELRARGAQQRARARLDRVAEERLERRGVEAHEDAPLRRRRDEQVEERRVVDEAVEVEHAHAHIRCRERGDHGGGAEAHLAAEAVGEHRRRYRDEQADDALRAGREPDVQVAVVRDQAHEGR